MNFDVVIVGYRFNAKEPAAQALARILKLDPEAARRLARNFPATVRSKLTKDKAEDLVQELEEAGAVVELHAEAPTGLHKLPAKAAAPAAARKSMASSDKISLDLAPAPQPRAAQKTDQHRAPPAPPAAAFASYQLGDFGLGGPKPAASLRPGAARVVPAPPPPGPDIAGLPAANGAAPRSAAARRASITSNMDLDIDMNANMPLELDEPETARVRRSSPEARRSAPEETHTLGERFGDETPVGRAPQVEERAYRSIQRRPGDSRRPGMAKRNTPTQRILDAVRDWAPSLLMLVVLSAVCAGAVGWALDPDDAFGALLRQRVSALDTLPPTSSPAPSSDEARLHPLLRVTPPAARGPLAVILRSRMQGVHDVEVVYHGRPKDFHCVVVENEEGRTEARLAEVRSTGRELPVPQQLVAQLREREGLLRSELKQPALQFSELCLVQ